MTTSYPSYQNNFETKPADFWSDIPFYGLMAVMPFTYWLDSWGYIWAFLALLALVSFVAVLNLPHRTFYANSIRIWFLSLTMLTVFVGLNLGELSITGFFDMRVFITPFVFFLIFIAYRKLSQEELTNLILYFILVNSLALILEAVLVNSGILNHKLVPAYHYARNYEPSPNRFALPFGLTGVYSVNGALQVYLYSLYYFFCKSTNTRVNRKLTLLSVAGLAVSGSGAGYICGVVFGFFVLLWQNRFLVKAFSLIAVMLVILVSVSGRVPKLDIEYLTFMEHIYLQDISYFLSNTSTFFQLLLGNRDSVWSFESFPLVTVGYQGLIYFSVFWWIVWAGFKSFDNRYALLAFWILFIGTIHYPTAFFLPTQILTAIIIANGLANRVRPVKI